MTLLHRHCKLKIDRDGWRGKQTCLWSLVLFWDRSWSVTCSRCYWSSSQGLGPDPRMTAVCKQRRKRGEGEVQARYQVRFLANEQCRGAERSFRLCTLWLSYNPTSYQFETELSTRLDHPGNVSCENMICGEAQQLMGHLEKLFRGTVALWAHRYALRFANANAGH